MLTIHKIIRYDDGAQKWEAEIDLESHARVIPGCVRVSGPTHSPYYLLLADGKKTARLPKEAR